MQNQGFESASSHGRREGARDAASKTADLGQAAMDTAREAADKARQAASETVASVSDHVRELLDRQVVTGADLMTQFAGSTKRAAEELDKTAPQIAGLVHGVADRIDGYADDLRERSAAELLRSASDLTRRQPALVFGLAALGGFFAFRLLKDAPRVVHSASIQPDMGDYSRPMSSPHGV